VSLGGVRGNGESVVARRVHSLDRPAGGRESRARGRVEDGESGPEGWSGGMGRANLEDGVHDPRLH
jgi:hypothetical protein